MRLDELTDLLDATLKPLGSTPEPGEEYEVPELDVLRYDRRAVRLHWMPVIGRGQSIVATVRNPRDLGATAEGYRGLLDRAGRAAHGRFPPRWGGAVLGMTVLALTPERLRPEDEGELAKALARAPRGRAVPLGLFRLNLDEETVAFALTEGPGVFQEPPKLADALCERFRRFVPLVPM